MRYGDGASSSTRGLFGASTTPGFDNAINYVTIASTGNATDFGDSVAAVAHGAMCSNSQRALFAGGQIAPASAVINSIDYVTIATTGNAADFGDLTKGNSSNAGMSDSHGGLTE